MSEWAIKVEGLSKKYNILHKTRNQDDTLIKAFAGGLKSMYSGSGRQSREEFWALRDVDFTVKQGDRVGIIGRNGAGKSTLLKVLSRVVKPSSGRIEYNGRMASLLEVGTGFHGDLTGRENIYLNGTILGMQRREIDRKFDEIVAFSEIEQFLDTPVKRYSSGMYVKLAFSVAAHMSPDIIILDEVLAVGDASFQKKCISKMNELSRTEGRTLMFVSHNMSSVRSLCNYGIFLEKGILMNYGPIEEVVKQYQQLISETLSTEVMVAVQALDTSGEWLLNTDLEIQVSWSAGRYEPGWHCDVAAYAIDGAKVFALQSNMFEAFSSSDRAANGAVFRVRNIGYAAQELRLDVGIRKHVDEPYCLVLENCASLLPSSKNLFDYARADVITVPYTTCRAKIG